MSLNSLKLLEVKMDRKKMLYTLINSLWTFIKEHDADITDSEESWQQLMDDADKLLSKGEQPYKKLLSDWILAYMQYADRREQRIMQGGNEQC